MKVVGLIVFFSLMAVKVSAMGCDNNLPKEIFNHWIHSFEEDTKEVQVFRSSDYRFPRARGRQEFEIKENGEFVQYRISPTDRLEKIIGRWKVEGQYKIIVHFKDKKNASYTIDIISYNDGILKIKK